MEIERQEGKKPVAWTAECWDGEYLERDSAVALSTRRRQTVITSPAPAIRSFCCINWHSQDLWSEVLVSQLPMLIVCLLVHHLKLVLSAHCPISCLVKTFQIFSLGVLASQDPLWLRPWLQFTTAWAAGLPFWISRPTRPSTPPGSTNEYRLMRLRRQMPAYLFPFKFHFTKHKV